MWEWLIWKKDPDGFHLEGVFALSSHNSPATGSRPAKNPSECVSSRGRRRGQVLCRKERKSRKKGNLARTEISQERKSHRWPLSEKKWILANCCQFTSRHVHSNVLTYTASVKKLLLLFKIFKSQLVPGKHIKGKGAKKGKQTNKC